MNLSLTSLEIIVLCYQLYQFEETCMQSYRSTFSRIQFYLALAMGLLVASVFLPPSWYHLCCLSTMVLIPLCYRHQENWIYHQVGLFASYVFAIGCYVVVKVVFPMVSLWFEYSYAQTLLLMVIAYGVQVLFMAHQNKTYDQMYVYPVMLLTVALAFLLMFSIAQRMIASQSGWILTYQGMLLGTMAMYRFCYCLEVSKEKELLALEKTYAIIGNKEKYEVLQKENDYILKNLHDMKKQLRLLEEVDKSPELQEYREKIKEKAEILLQVPRTGTAMIDHVLQRYQLQFYEAKIQFNVESEEIDYGFMDPIDMCAVLCNMLDNAYESCLQCETRFILLKLRTLQQQVFWKMKNSVALTTRVEKETTFAHGFGLRNMQRIAKRYQGNLTCTIDPEHAIYTTVISFSTTAYVSKMTTSTSDKPY